LRNTNDLGAGAARVASESRVFYLLGDANLRRTGRVPRQLQNRRPQFVVPLGRLSDCGLLL